MGTFAAFRIRFRLRSASLFLCLVLMVSVALAEKTESATCDIPGTRPATEDDAVVKNGQIKVGTCYNPNEIGIGQNAEEAKQYLKTLRCTGSCNFGLLNDSFAVCSARFFKAFQGQYGPVEIVSAYRSPGHERDICRDNPRCGAQMNNPNPTSNHSNGLAIDVYYRPSQSFLWNFAKQNKQLGVCFPFEDGGGGGFSDRPHMILQGIPGSREAASCVQRGYGSTPCSGSNFDPSSVRSVPGGPPSSRLSDIARNFLNPPQPPQQMCPLPGGGSVPCSAIANLGGGQPPAGGTPAGGAPSGGAPGGAGAARHSTPANRNTEHNALCAGHVLPAILLLRQQPLLQNEYVRRPTQPRMPKWLLRHLMHRYIAARF